MAPSATDSSAQILCPTAKANTKSEVQPIYMDQKEFLRMRGWSSMKGFMASYSLDYYDSGDYAEAQIIVKGLRDDAQAKWEKENKK